jgi:hypothetical protein
MSRRKLIIGLQRPEIEIRPGSRLIDVGLVLQRPPKLHAGTLLPIGHGMASPRRLTAITVVEKALIAAAGLVCRTCLRNALRSCFVGLEPCASFHIFLLSIEDVLH